MDHPDFIVGSFMENSIGLKWLNFIKIASFLEKLKLVFIFIFRQHPVLLQGETSVGKTSLITWLARSSGNVCVRVNNHEHTDLQEYVGCYAADENGKLAFREGKLLIFSLPVVTSLIYSSRLLMILGC